MFFKKAKIAIPILVVALSSANVMPIYASSLPIVATTNVEMSLRAAVTGYIYRIYNGVLQKRLWSYTKNAWIDTYWHNA